MRNDRLTHVEVLQDILIVWELSAVVVPREAAAEQVTGEPAGGGCRAGHNYKHRHNSLQSRSVTALCQHSELPSHKQMLNMIPARRIYIEFASARFYTRTRRRTAFSIWEQV